ncbi:hypothetical protein V3G39_09865 [Dermatophilaceae bacterium Sec6.4]
MTDTTVRTVVYGDFTCWRCALANRRADLLRGSGYTVEWRAVENEHGLPVRGRRRTAHESERVLAVRSEFSPQLRAGEILPQGLPDLVPKTTAAVSAYAEAVVANVADQVRGLLFASYWRDGTDIGDPEILRTLLAAEFMSSDATSDPIARFGYAVAMTREPITTAAWRLIREWRDGWAQLQRAQLPLVVDSSGTYCGDAALQRLAELLKATHPAVDGEHPRVVSTMQDWEPLTAVDPPEAWTSQVGDPWRRAGIIRRAGLRR